ncbi:zinc ribbon domain-containing protein [Haladaptatus halobius]|uniref:zinc ribbon domain-containing protein n=1 Tax=Haladaptatus halobius TaxID=2884875 RepID=UPI001D0AE9A6|nr:zinc ribbon domain-containing protein [Haladaptatus halobius]
MNLRAEHGVYLAVWLVVIAFLVIFFYMGPFGWNIGIFVLLAVLKLADLSGFFQGTPSEPKRSCSECGARNPADRTACHYCDEPLTAAP